ncbi:MAG: PDZ domain-containing protein, partial [Elusimicrobia bacterium]|nr:PDZ domain-containing protein [Elusimicrobiota bacterium]
TAPPADAALDLGPQWSVQLRLLAPLTLYEPESYYRAGPGLWLKEVSESGLRALEVTRVTPGRSADHAGLKPGDRVYGVDGTASSRLGFADALDKLYGAPGTSVSLRVVRRGSSRPEELKLVRGAWWRRGYGLRLRREGDSIVVEEATAGSPSGAAGVKRGDALLQVSGQDAAGLDRNALRDLLETDGVAVEFVFSDGTEKRAAKLTRDWYSSTLSPDLQPAPYAP